MKFSGSRRAPSCGWDFALLIGWLVRPLLSLAWIDCHGLLSNSFWLHMSNLWTFSLIFTTKATLWIPERWEGWQEITFAKCQASTERRLDLWLAASHPRIVCCPSCHWMFKVFSGAMSSSCRAIHRNRTNRPPHPRAQWLSNCNVISRCNGTYLYSSDNNLKRDHP